jgi:methylated-DNA-[protein]-cysteine S-methyltransferase
LKHEQKERTMARHVSRSAASDVPVEARLCVATVITDLGWIALAGSDSSVVRISFARGSRAAALAALDGTIRKQARPCDWNPSLATRLQEYAAGAPDDFRDVRLDLGDLTPFQQRILKACRAIGYGQTRSYGEVAKAAGNPRAARAVGNTMAANRFALVVPSHRVVHSGGDSGRLSGSARLRKKLRLLETFGPGARTAGRVSAGRASIAFERVS